MSVKEESLLVSDEWRVRDVITLYNKFTKYSLEEVVGTYSIKDMYIYLHDSSFTILLDTDIGYTKVTARTTDGVFDWVVLATGSEAL